MRRIYTYSGEVLTLAYGECIKLCAALQDADGCRQVNAQSQMEKLYELDERLYLHIQPCGDGYDYTIYDKNTCGRWTAGSECPQLPIAEACLEICDLHNIETILSLTQRGNG